MNPKSPIGRGGFETRPNRESSDWSVVVMPNHVHGIVVMVGDFGIIVLVGGFQTRPHGRGHGDFVIVALVGILVSWSFVGAGFKPARTVGDTGILSSWHWWVFWYRGLL